MPSGYTSDIYDGKSPSFEEFMLGLSRAMGFAVHQRDEGIGSRLRYRELNPYYAEEAKRCGEECEEWYQLTPAQLKERHVQYLTDERARYVENMQRNARLLTDYNLMLSRVREWEAPEGLEGLKDYAVEQLLQAIKFDIYERKLDTLSFDAWKSETEDAFERAVTWSIESYEKEVERVANANRLIDLLLESLGMESLDV
jgi:hypothetical protein